MHGGANRLASQQLITTAHTKQRPRVPSPAAAEDSMFTFQSPALTLLRDLLRDLDLDLDREAAAGLSRLRLLSRVRLTDQIRRLVSTKQGSEQ
ncbi:MAG: hypothetical protein FRX49_08177 [Trebouxia sp. A1-2]|nr:MAG: hypothetical protein FRX49_08177 [Trebouxia sp. A1-2]